MATNANGDPTVRAILARCRSGETVDFDWLRERYKASNGTWESLDRGRAVPHSIEQLDQYLWSYAPMVASQWRHAARVLPALPKPTRWIDYGCGQGLAGLLIRDIAGAATFDQVQHVVLVEPSLPALRRAEAIYGCVAPHAAITCIHSGFEQLPATALNFADGLDSVHIFSNVLDVPGFDAPALVDKALQPGHNIIVSVSHDRESHGGTPRIRAVKARVEDPARAPRLSVSRARLDTFHCDNQNQADAILWYCEIDV